MAMDQMETFNWLVSENNRMTKEIEGLKADRSNLMERCFDLAFVAAKNNPAIRKLIEDGRKAETPDPAIFNFVLRASADG